MEHKEERYSKESIATATTHVDESKNATQVLEKSSSNESKGVLGSVLAAAGGLAESVKHAVQGTIDAAYQTAERLQHDAETIGVVGGYVAHKVADKASTVYESVADSTRKTQTESPLQPGIDQFFSSPTNDMMQASTVYQKTTDTTEKFGAIYDQTKQTVSNTFSAATIKATEAFETAKSTVNDAITSAEPTIEAAKQTITDAFATAGKTASDVTASAAAAAGAAGEQPLSIAPTKFELSMDIVAHLQRIADRTGDSVLHDTARKAHSACAKGVSDAPGVHLVKVTPDQATELVNLAIMTQDHELADFARYCQSVAATTQLGIEPYPGKIQEELAKGRQVLQTQGRVHTGPGYGAAFASVGRAAPLNVPAELPAQSAPAPSSAFSLTMDMVAHIQRIADRTGDAVLHDTARKAHSACAKNLSDFPGVHLVKVTPDQATELVNLAIRTQDHGLANFARYCQSVAATTQIGIEPTPGKIVEEISKGRQELAQGGRAHTGPGYGAAFASISRSNSQQNLSRSGSQQNVASTGSQQPILARATSQQTLTKPKAQPALGRAVSQQNLKSSGSLNRSSLQNTASQSAPTPAPQQSSNMQLTMDVVAHLQRIADRTGDSILHETARRAHSACAKSISEYPGVNLTFITPDQATELVNLAIRTQDHELANFARYCQSVAATTGIAVEPEPGKIQQEIEKGRVELQQLGRTHTGPGYGAAFASIKPAQSNQPDLAKPLAAPEQLAPGVGQPLQ